MEDEAAIRNTPSKTVDPVCRVSAKRQLFELATSEAETWKGTH